MARLALALVLGLVACEQEPSRLDAVLSRPSGAAPAATPEPSAAAVAADGISGTVVETMSAGGYTYARLDSNIWVAGPETPLTVGTKLARMEGNAMPNFHSNTLNRTFPQIYFINSFGPHAAAAAVTAPPTRNEKVAVAPGGKTVADIFAGKDALAGKSIVVRGKVVKLNTGIMRRNWIHLRDGTGAAGTDDLLVTSQDTVTLGDTVTVTGTVATHQDFGAGYAYDVIVENATFATK